MSWPFSSTAAPSVQAASYFRIPRTYIDMGEPECAIQAHLRRLVEPSPTAVCMKATDPLGVDQQGALRKTVASPQPHHLSLAVILA